jgi:hypothetical protein
MIREIMTNIEQRTSSTPSTATGTIVTATNPIGSALASSNDPEAAPTLSDFRALTGAAGGMILSGTEGKGEAAVRSGRGTMLGASRPMLATRAGVRCGGGVAKSVPMGISSGAREGDAKVANTGVDWVPWVGAGRARREVER